MVAAHVMLREAVQRLRSAEGPPVREFEVLIPTWCDGPSPGTPAYDDPDAPGGTRLLGQGRRLRADEWHALRDKARGGIAHVMRNAAHHYTLWGSLEQQHGGTLFAEYGSADGEIQVRSSRCVSCKCMLCVCWWS